MANREQFQLGTEIRFERDNAAVDAILMVIEDAFGRDAVRRTGGESEASAAATICVRADGIDAREVNRLHAELGRLAKYLLEPAEVSCSDAEGREQPYTLDPAAPATPAAASSGDGEAEAAAGEGDAAGGDETDESDVVTEDSPA